MAFRAKNLLAEKALTLIFAADLIKLGYGVKVAQQILILFV